jgi:hypothetical protein
VPASGPFPAAVFGAEKGTYEVLGTITDAYSWWGDVVLMEIKALRKVGQLCVVITDDQAILIGEELIQKELDAKAAWLQLIHKKRYYAGRSCIARVGAADRGP